MKGVENGKVEVAGKEYPVNAQEINLDSKDLKSIPNLDHFTQLKRIYLLGNKIEKIEKLKGLLHLE